jgi:hypothetical protein
MGSYTNNELAERVVQIMADLGFNPTHTGPYVTELRDYIKDKAAKGLCGMTRLFYEPITKETANDIARRYLAWFWSVEHTSIKMECIDGPPLTCYYNTATGRREYSMQWHRVLPYLRDQFRRVAVMFRRKRVNPYKD